jgi:type I restriction-modification system DNA methylase subunit
MATESGKLFPFHNVGLFSNHFLTKRLPAESSLWNSEKVAAQAAFEKIIQQYKQFKASYKSANEAQTEQDFIRPVLDLLGYSYIVQTSLKHHGKFNQPDYALFADDKTKKEAGFKVKEQEAFYGKALAICDAKYWGRPLDIKLSDKKDTLTNVNPSFQIVNYLVGANVDWGILTNGKLWRLYYQKASSRSSNFYEVDLEDLLLKKNATDFLYFYLFFRKDAFVQDSHGKTFLDHVLASSTEYAAELSYRLKANVFEDIFPHLARGFLHYRRSALGIKTETDDSLKEIYNGTLTLLYRLLFILYAEDRDLLPRSEDAYHHYSLASLKQSVANLRDKKATLTDLSTDLWGDLETLFRIIDLGEPKLNVPAYNGGLFSHKNPKNDFLKINRVPDPWLAKAIDHLTRELDKETGKPQFVDYAELEVRHLGSIYEGLLEFYLKIADEDKAVVKEKGREVYKPVTQVKTPKEIVKQGDLYLENDKHERKSTGSYYTPDYIVQYIVQNTVAPVLDEKLKNVAKLFTEISSLEAKVKRATTSRAAQADHLKTKKQEAIDELFSLRILDPAMGSGHFLVETVDFLSDHIIKFLHDHPDNPILEEIERLRSIILSDLKKKGIRIDDTKLIPTNLVRRMVMKRCIYGVDLNPMAVELAKLSLWLHSFTLGAPLSFLDHHLRCGNSLIGANVKTVKGSMEEVKVGEEGRYVDWEGREKLVPEQKAMYLFGSQFAGLLSATELMRQVGELTDSTFEEVQESQQKYERAADALKPFKLILDLWTSEHFGNKHAQHFLTHGGDIEAFLKGNGRLPEKIRKLRNETEHLSHNKHFFHWELEFPEVFYEGAREKENPGFDAVIGNPPYGNIADVGYLRANYPATQHNSDVYVAFIERARAAARHAGWSGYIVPVTWQTGVSYADLRKQLLENTRIDKLVNLPFDVFPEAYVDTCITVFQNTTAGRNLNAQVFAFPKKAKATDLTSLDYKLIPQSEWLEGRQTIIVDPVQLFILRQLASDSLTQMLKSITDSARGILAAPEDIAGNPRDSSWKPFFDGEMDRYVINQPSRFVRYGDNLREHPSSFDFFQGERLLVRRLVNRQDRLMATAAVETFVNKKDIYNFKVNSPKYSTLFLLALLNSRLLSFVYLQQDVAATKDDFRQTTLDGLRALPVRLIEFSTPAKERSRLLDKAKTLCDKCYAQKDVFCVTGFVEQCLKQKMKQADVVHDLLAFLAQRMIEMNREKQAETKGFLEWLESAIGAKVDDLKNKTKIRVYHEGILDNLLDVLKENSKALKKNPSSKDFYEVLKEAFQKSMAKLLPLKNQIAISDRLIDLVVYRIYGLTEEEIRIVEGD